MAQGEFDLIARWFSRPQDRSRGAVVLGGGDDCALLDLPAGRQWAVSTDTLVEGRHFLSTVPPARLGHKALAVNLSDLAACGAEPRAYFLCLTLPRIDAAWLDAFACGLHALADEAGIVLAGGDTTAGPLTLGLTVMGTVPTGRALLRSGALPGDELWVSHPVGGGLGDARLALECFRDRVSLTTADFESTRLRMEMPQARLGLGMALRGLAHACIDLSDGLLGDLGHVLRASGVGAELNWEALPRSQALSRQSEALQRECLLSGGDDYELLFAAPTDRRADVEAAAAACGLGVARIGRVVERGLAVRRADGSTMDVPQRGFDHFAQD